MSSLAAYRALVTPMQTASDDGGEPESDDGKILVMRPR